MDDDPKRSIKEQELDKLTADVEGTSISANADTEEEILSEKDTTTTEGLKAEAVVEEKVPLVQEKEEPPPPKGQEKINIRLNPVGNAPIVKQKLWAVPADKEVGQIIEFFRKYLKLDKQQSLFLFVNQAFAPSPDQPLKELYECFGSDGKIVLHYSTTYAWG